MIYITNNYDENIIDGEEKMIIYTTIITPFGGKIEDNMDIPAGAIKTISTNVIGFGIFRPVDITVTVNDNADNNRIEKTVTARIILFFIRIISIESKNCYIYTL